MGMGLARDVRSANVAAAERNEQKEYRDMRTKALKKQMRRGKKADKIAASAEVRAVDAAEMIQKINKQKLKNARNPAITAFNNHKGLLEEYQKNSRAADQRFAGELAPVNKALAEAKMSFTAA